MNERTDNLPDDDINSILADPFAWAEKYAEDSVMASVDDFITAKKLGMEFAKKNVKALK